MTTSLYRRVAMVHLGGAGVLTAVMGVWLLTLPRPALVQHVFRTLEPYLMAQALLRDAPAVVSSVTRATPVLGAALLTVGVVGLGIAWQYRGERTRRVPAAAAALLVLNPLVAPLALIALALLVLADRDAVVGGPVGDPD